MDWSLVLVLVLFVALIMATVAQVQANGRDMSAWLVIVVTVGVLVFLRGAGYWS